MNIAQIKTTDVINGPGVRLTVFVSGCTNRCKGCFQPQTWDFGYGIPYTEEIEAFIMKELEKPYYRGITFLGGEPFEPCNQSGILPLIKRIKEELPDKDIWAFTGNVYEDLLPGGKRYTKDTDAILDSIDVLVDGRFVEELKDPRLKFRGSSNQRLIDMKETRKTNRVVLMD